MQRIVDIYSHAAERLPAYDGCDASLLAELSEWPGLGRVPCCGGRAALLLLLPPVLLSDKPSPGFPPAGTIRKLASRENTSIGQLCKAEFAGSVL